MIKVLFVSHTSQLNGAERMLLETVRELDRGKFDPLLMIPRPGPLGLKAGAAGIRTVVVPMKWSLSGRKSIWKQPLSRIWNVRSVLRTTRLIRTEQVSLVVSNTAACWSGARAARRAGVPHVWFIHEILGGERPFLAHIRGERALVRTMDRLSVRIVANSAATAQAFAVTGKTVVIGNGIDIRLFDSVDRAASRRSLNPANTRPVLGIIGVICRGKGQMEAVLATDILRRRYPDTKLVVVGVGLDRTYFEMIQAEIRRLGLGNNVAFLGYRNDIPAVLAGLDVLVVASSVDSLGRVALEAMAAGTPVVAAARGGIPEIVKNGETGVLVDSPDPESLAAGIMSLLDDPRKAKTVAEGGRKFVETEFSLSGQVRKIERVLEESLEK